MKAINLMIIAAGISLFVIRSIYGYIYFSPESGQIGFANLLIYKWGIQFLLLTSYILIWTNVMAKISRDGKKMENRGFMIVSYLSLTFLLLAGFSIEPDDYNIILERGLVYLFAFPMFLGNFLLLFYLFVILPITRKLYQPSLNE